MGKHSEVGNDMGVRKLKKIRWLNGRMRNEEKEGKMRVHGVSLA